MNTPTHALVGLAALTRQDDPARSRWILLGALVPDIIIFLWAPWQRWGLGRDWSAIWDIHYFETPMQTLIALFNSLPIYLALLFLALVFRTKLWAKPLLVFSLAALLHLALDAPFHGHDAYRHLWPLSDWRFFSPISYWEADLHARWVSFLEAGLVLGCAIILWRRHPHLWVKALLLSLVLFAGAVALMQQLAG